MTCYRSLRQSWAIVRASAILLIMGLIYPTQSHSQCGPSAQIETLPFYAVSDCSVDSNGNAVVDSSIVIQPHEIIPYYIFDTQQEYTRIRLRLGEIHAGSNIVYFDNWCKDSTHLATPGSGLISNTVPFVLHPGDTLQVYREYYWIDQIRQEVNPSVLRLVQDVSFSIEIVDAASHQRMVLLDSIHFHTNNGADPCLYTTFPPMHTLRYVAPEQTSSSQEVYIRIRADPSMWSRSDVQNVALSTQHLSNRYWQEYAEQVMSSVICGIDR